MAFGWFWGRRNVLGINVFTFCWVTVNVFVSRHCTHMSEIDEISTELKRYRANGRDSD